MILTDNITPTAAKGIEAQKGLKKTIEDTNKTSMGQDVQWLKQITTLSVLKEGTTAMVGEMRILGIVNESQYNSLRKVAAGIGLIVDTARTLKGVVALFDMLQVKEIALAGVETYRAVLNNPAMAGAAMVAFGAAGGAVGFLAGGGAKNINISFMGGGRDTPRTRQASRAAIEATGG